LLELEVEMEVLMTSEMEAVVGSGGRFGEFDYSSGGRTLSFTVGKRGNDGASNAKWWRWWYVVEMD
jgi:hypothetical protein